MPWGTQIHLPTQPSSPPPLHAIILQLPILPHVLLLSDTPHPHNFTYCLFLRILLLHQCCLPPPPTCHLLFSSCLAPFLPPPIILNFPAHGSLKQVSLLVDGVVLTPSALAARFGVTSSAARDALMQQALLAGLCFHAYQQVSYMILQRVSPITHSVGNCVKRVIIIVASVVVFR